jgi:hypothetical protein
MSENPIIIPSAIKQDRKISIISINDVANYYTYIIIIRTPLSENVINCC